MKIYLEVTAKGTYPKGSASPVTLTITEIWGSTELLPWDEAFELYEGQPGFPESNKVSATIAGDILTYMGQALTRQK
jgi:hypothetical protein